MRNSLENRGLSGGIKKEARRKIILTKSHMVSPLKVPNELASEHEPESALVAEFALVPDTLHLCVRDEDGAYWSREEPGRSAFWSLVRRTDTSIWSRADGMRTGCLRDFKCGMLG